MFARLFGVFVLVHIANTQNPSPCPQVFSYEPRGREQDRWYGVISLQSKEDLDGVWLKIVLDEPAELLGNWFGQTISSDNEEFTIRNLDYTLKAGPPVSVRFFVKYNTASTTPSVKDIKLNGKTICLTRRQEAEPTSEPLYISAPKPVTNRPASRPNSRPAGRPAASNEEDGYLHNREPTSYERPNDYDTTTSSVGGSRRPSNNNYNNNNNNNNNNNRPPSKHGGSSSNSGGSSSSTSSSSSIRRPSSSGSGSSSSSSSSGNTNYNHRERESTNSGSTSNHLSVDEETRPDGTDYFPGDFAAVGPTHTRQPSRRPIIVKRNVACGTVAMKPRPLISFGQNTTQGEWPWHAALYYSQGAQLMYTCGATLISENHILTAAHCVAKPQTNRPIDTQKLAVYLGKYSLKKFGPEIQDREVTKIFIHPQYNHSVYFNDIAVLKLKDPIDITDYVRPCCLWEGGNDLEYVLNKSGTVVGWGFDENREISDNLMQAKMPVVSTTTCIYSNREFFSHFTFEKTYCAGFRNGTTVCNGDSGGGMVFPKAASNGNTIWHIRGIVSVGVALQGQGVCDPKHYIVFTDVAKHLDWIKEVMNE